MVGKVERRMSRTDRPDRRVMIEGSWGYVGMEDEGAVEFLKQYGRNGSVMEVIVAVMKGAMSSMGRYMVDEMREMNDSAVMECLVGIEEKMTMEMARVVEEETTRVTSGVAEMLRGQQEAVARARVEEEEERRRRREEETQGMARVATEMVETVRRQQELESERVKVALRSHEERAVIESERVKVALQMHEERTVLEIGRVMSAMQQQQSMVSVMVGAVEGAVGAAMERVSTEGMMRVVSDVLSEEMRKVREGHKDSLSALEEMEGRLRSCIRCDVLEPIVAQHARLTTMMVGLPGQVDEVCGRLGGRTAEEVRAIEVHLREVRGMMDGVLLGQTRDASAVTAAREASEGCISRVLREADQMWKDVAGWEKRLPEMMRGVMGEMLGDVESRVQQMRDQASSVRAQVTKMEEGVAAMSEVRQEVSGAATRLEKVVGDVMSTRVKQTSSSQTKGVVGERRLYEMLVDTLPMREGYEVEMTTGQAYSCDMVIRKAGFPDVRVECKAYGEQTGTNVGKGEVSKFRRDLELMGTHGIFVSLHSGIVGIGKKFHMEQMPNGKFAVYLGENGYDTETIHSMLMILYKLDKVTREGDEGYEGATLRVSSETMMRVQVYLGEVASKMKTVVASLRSNITMLNEMSVDTVVQMLMGERGVAAASAAAAAAGKRGAVSAAVAVRKVVTPPALAVRQPPQKAASFLGASSAAPAVSTSTPAAPAVSSSTPAASSWAASSAPTVRAAPSAGAVKRKMVNDTAFLRARKVFDRENQGKTPEEIVEMWKALTKAERDYYICMR
jgi:hypothetical protein